MEHKIDKKFKSELDQRTMNPNPAAWDRLDAMLSMEEKKKPFFFRSWMAVAAGFIGLMMVVLISLPFIDSNNDEIITKNLDKKTLFETENNNSNEIKTRSAENIQLPNNHLIANNLTQKNKPTVIQEKNKIELIDNVATTIKTETEEINAITEKNEKIQKNSNAPQTVDEHKKVDIVSIENDKSKNVIPEFQPKIKLKKVKVDANVLLTNAEEEKKSLLQRVLVVANNTGSNVYEKVANRNIDIH